MPIRLTPWVEAALAVRMWAPVDAYVGDSIGPPQRRLEVSDLRIQLRRVTGSPTYLSAPGV